MLLVPLLAGLVSSLQLSERLQLPASLRFSPQDKHRELLEDVIEFGLNRSSHLVEVQERALYDKGSYFIIIIAKCPFLQRTLIIREASEKMFDLPASELVG